MDAEEAGSSGAAREVKPVLGISRGRSSRTRKIKCFPEQRMLIRQVSAVPTRCQPCTNAHRWAPSSRKGFEPHG